MLSCCCVRSFSLLVNELIRLFDGYKQHVTVKLFFHAANAVVDLSVHSITLR